MGNDVKSKYESSNKERKKSQLQYYTFSYQSADYWPFDSDEDTEHELL